MYMKYYGLNAKPFRLSPDPHFFFTSTTHKSAFAYLRYGLHQGEGFVVVTGAAGTGKTTLMLTLLAKQSSRDMVIGKLVTTQLQPDDLLRSIAAAFHVDARGVKAELITRLQEFLQARARAKQRVLLVVDEAHNLPQNSFEEMRMLSNFQHGASALLQCILLGQPPLWEMLTRSNMEHLHQRVIAAHQLHPLNAEETRGYILHRLRLAAWRGDPSFSAGAIKLIHRYCNGVPRRINSLCDRILLFGALEEIHHIDADVLAQVYSEWAVETGHDTAVGEPLPQTQVDDVNLTGLGYEHVVVAHAVGADTVPPLKRPVVAPHDRAASYLSPVSSTAPTDLEPDSEETVDPTTTIPLSPLAALRPVLKTMAGAIVVLMMMIVGISIWLGPSNEKQSPASDAITSSPPRQARQVVVMPPPPIPTAPDAVHQDVSPKTTSVTASIAEDFTETVGGTSTTTENPDRQEVRPAPATGVRSTTQLPPAVAQVSSTETIEPKHAVATIAKPAPMRPTTRDHADEVKNKTAITRLDAPPTDPIQMVALKPQAHTAITTNHRKAPAKPSADATLKQMDADTHSVPQIQVQKPESSTPTEPAPLTAQVEPAASMSENLPLDKDPAPASTANVTTPPEQANSESISTEALTALLTRFKGAYDAGDMKALTRLFAKNARSDNAHDRAAIAESYRKLFNMTDMRQLALDNIRWVSAGAAIQGEGPFDVRLREKGRVLISSYSGHISLRIEHRDGQPVITRLEYFYTQ